MSDTGDIFPGFDSHWIDSEAGRIFARSKGEGPPVVLLHGFPQTHACWHRLAPALAETHTVVCMDLRGYGWSSAPPGDPAHETYSKRAMARDVVAVMEALDQAGRVERLALLDILPTVHVWRQIRAGAFPARHWAFLARPGPEPEREIG